jgi:hypothetical protein
VIDLISIFARVIACSIITESAIRLESIEL